MSEHHWVSADIMSQVSTRSLVLYTVIGSVLIWQIYVFIVTAIINGLDGIVDVNDLDSSLISLFKMISKLAICVAAMTIIMAALGVDLIGILMSAGVAPLGHLGAQ